MQKLKIVRAPEAHLVEIKFQHIGDVSEGSYVLTMEYLEGDLALETRTLVARFIASYQNFQNGSPGHIDLGQGDTRIDVPELRGIGVGSFLMGLLIEAVQSKLPSLEVETIYLSIDDAWKDHERDRRNHFWEKLGYTFTYQDSEKRSGYSNRMLSDKLIPPPQQLLHGWTIEEIE